MIRLTRENAKKLVNASFIIKMILLIVFVYYYWFTNPSLTEPQLFIELWHIFALITLYGIALMYINKD